MKLPKRPPWLVAAIGVSLILLLGIWLGLRQPIQTTDTTASPPVVYEDFSRKPEQEAGGKPEQIQPPITGRHLGLAIIMDDAGYDLKVVRRVLALPYPVAVSILSSAPFARDAAGLVRKADRIVMLHLPMEPIGQRYRDRMGDDFLRAGMDQHQIEQIVRSELAAVPYVQGVNNHMGSRLTTMKGPMKWVMQVLRRHSLFFIDSRTIKDSVAADEAMMAGIPWGSRRIFLDHDPAPAAIKAAWEAAVHYYHGHGACIVIAHPNRETLAFLEKGVSMQDQLAIVPVTRLLQQEVSP